MQMEELAKLTSQSNEPLTVSPEVFQQIGTITRVLHDTMQQLGVMPKLQVATDGLPDARSRLTYIANKTADAANKVLNSVDQAKAEHAKITEAANAMAPGDHRGPGPRGGVGRGAELRQGGRILHVEESTPT